MSFLTEYFDICEGEGEHPVCCPFPHHTSSGLEYYETNPSASVDTDNQLFHCMACGQGYNEAQFIMKILGCDYASTAKIKRCFQNTEDRPTWLNETTLTKESKDLATNLGISEKVLAELDVASEDLTNHLMYPVFMYDHLLDIRTYNPGGKPKVKSRMGCPAGLIIPFDIWRESPVTRWTLICAGEKDMAVARSHGFNAITITGGEGTQPIQLNYFKDRNVAIVYDNDSTGINGAKKLARTLSKYAKTIKVVTGFHEICKEEKEDITDFFVKYGQDKNKLIQYIENTPSYNIEEDTEAEQKRPTMNLLEASKANNIGKTVTTNVQVVSVSEDTFACPKIAIAEKFKESEGGNDFMAVGEIRQWELQEDNLKDVLHLVDNNFTEEKIKEHLRNLMKIMQKEKYVKFKIIESVTVFKAYITDLFETTDNISAQPMEYVVYSIGKKLESGKKYRLTHKLVPHPYKGQQLISIAMDYSQASDSITDFVVDETEVTNLKVIQSIEGSVEEKINTQVQKVKGLLGYNGNDTLITALDLAYNTVLQFNFGTFKNVRGYIDTLVVSESRVGKSSTTDTLRRTYGLGAIVSLAGNSATIPGLVGGSNKTTTGYQTRAGVIPQNHKGLINFEEFGKSSHQISAELTDIRSSNEVRIARVSGTITLPALVRMITLTNPKTVNGQIKSIASYPNGIEILTELVPSAEDIARYDMIVILSDRGANAIDPLWVPDTPFAQEVYRTRIRWVWSRTPDQIIISDTVAKHIVAQANDLNKTYGCHIKIFGTEAWKKITRLAIAVAGYVVSTDETYQNIIVLQEHVDFAVKFFKRIYDNSTFKLKEYVEHEKRYSEIDEEGIANLQNIYDKTPMVVLQLEQSATTTRNVLQAAAGMTHEELNKSLNELTKGLFIQFSGYDIIPTERFRLGVAKINKNTRLKKIGEDYA